MARAGWVTLCVLRAGEKRALHAHLRNLLVLGESPLNLVGGSLDCRSADVALLGKYFLPGAEEGRYRSLTRHFELPGPEARFAARSYDNQVPLVYLWAHGGIADARALEHLAAGILSLKRPRTPRFAPPRAAAALDFWLGAFACAPPLPCERLKG